MAFAFITPIEDVATDTDIENEIGEQEFCSLVDDGGDGTNARSLALEDVVQELKNRTPPIREENLVTVSELKVVVVYGACARLYRSNMTTGSGDDINSAKEKLYRGMYDSRLAALRPAVTGNQVGGPFGIALNRR